MRREAAPVQVHELRIARCAAGVCGPSESSSKPEWITSSDQEDRQSSTRKVLDLTRRTVAPASVWLNGKLDASAVTTQPTI
jgi:hypothetical protein